MYGKRSMKSFHTLSILDCEFAVIEPNQTTLKLYDLFRGYLEHEDNLINSRLTWSLTVHGFLFASYGILLGKIADEFSGLATTGAHPLLAEHIIAALFALQALVAILGVVIGFSSWGAIIASHNAIQHLVTIAHSQGRPLEIVARRATVLPGSILLPRIIGGGAKISTAERAQPGPYGWRTVVLLVAAGAHHVDVDSFGSHFRWLWDCGVAL